MRGFLCFRCPPRSHLRPTRQVSEIVGIRFAWFFVFPMSPAYKSHTRDPPGKCLTSWGFGFDGFWCFRCPPLRGHLRATRQVSDIMGIRFLFVAFCVSDVPLGKVYPDPAPAGKFLPFGGFGFRGFSCFRCPPRKSLPRPTRQVSAIGGVGFSWFFVFPMSPSAKSTQTHPTSV